MKTNKQLRRLLKIPHWQSNTQYCYWCKRRQEWIVVRANTWTSTIYHDIKGL